MKPAVNCTAAICFINALLIILQMAITNFLSYCFFEVGYYKRKYMWAYIGNTMVKKKLERPIKRQCSRELLQEITGNSTKSLMCWCWQDEKWRIKQKYYKWKHALKQNSMCAKPEQNDLEPGHWTKPSLPQSIQVSNQLDSNNTRHCLDPTSVKKRNK